MIQYKPGNMQLFLPWMDQASIIHTYICICAVCLCINIWVRFLPLVPSIEPFKSKFCSFESCGTVTGHDKRVRMII